MVNGKKQLLSKKRQNLLLRDFFKRFKVKLMRSILIKLQIYTYKIVEIKFFCAKKTHDFSLKNRSFISKQYSQCRKCLLKNVYVGTLKLVNISSMRYYYHKKRCIHFSFNEYNVIANDIFWFINFQRFLFFHVTSSRFSLL